MICRSAVSAEITACIIKSRFLQKKAQLISAFIFATRIGQLLFSSSFLPSSVTAHADLCWTASETPKTDFSRRGPVYQCGP